MKIDGGCHCGAIAYEAEVDPETAGICHCTDCQQLTGTAFRVIVFASEEAFRIVRGTPKIYVKTADNKLLELYFTESTTLTRNGQTVDFSELKEGQKVEVEFVKEGTKYLITSVK